MPTPLSLILISTELRLTSQKAGMQKGDTTPPPQLNSMVAQYIYAGRSPEFLFPAEALLLRRLTRTKYSVPGGKQKFLRRADESMPLKKDVHFVSL